ncbi:hypothetical protein PF005_g8930 [Phytophthora fragariae]|uniref:Uncharacterized protein n=2 Tax=Phytophthora TaxID=4783 RepID=A0A6A3LFW4_9STRA|nr:hypothetical protein PF003_g9098 [Phytophthora fragariae]KAE9045326.1 hypothetical protein PR002_g2294 [Phytophthora rubi]KAE8941178.1 hypothetical protein PF009_g9042 [Phytophthora fragariae]KAE9016948.1 hypothetical protein PF011_g6925 [Phytophthora fragariae]KAE9051994.1 hypothetical protein PR001_g927 [Phytophthora rubi]
MGLTRYPPFVLLCAQILHVKQALQEKEGIQVDQIRLITSQLASF